MYGIDDIAGWSRLTAVVPKDFLAQIDGAKAIVDFWVNVAVLSVLFLVEYVVVAISWPKYVGASLWMPIVALAVILLCHSRARSAAVGWGEEVKAAYDVFLLKLWTAMQFGSPTDGLKESELWTKFSMAILYRRPDQMPPRHYSLYFRVVVGRQ